MTFASRRVARAHHGCDRDLYRCDTDAGSRDAVDLDLFAQRRPKQTSRLAEQRADVDAAGPRWLRA
jgi:hypothetical protein